MKLSARDILEGAFPMIAEIRSRRLRHHRYRITRLAGALTALLVSVGSASAQNPPATDLKDLPPGQQVTDVSYCRGEYDVSLADGSSRRFKEYDLAFKTDSGPKAPRPAKPALVPTGRVGDRALVIFAALDELTRTLKTRCREGN